MGMSFRFYKTNKEIMDFNCKTEIHKIVFNHYIMRKANLHRLKGDLPDGQFKVTLRTAASDLNLSKSTIARLINEFEEKNIIETVDKSQKSGAYSVYQYVTIDNSKNMQKTETLYEANTRTEDEAIEISDFKGLSEVDETTCETKPETCDGTSNIENLNRELKINNIYSRVIDYLNKKTNKKFRSTTSKTRILILARLNDDFVEEDFYKVIDTKCEQWKDSPMEKYLRPETLFSNKFEGYLNEIGQVKCDDKEKITAYKIDFKY